MKEKMQLSISAEENAAPIRAVDLLYGVFFIGVLLSFAIYVGVSMIFSSAAVTDQTPTDDFARPMPLATYNEAYYENTSLQELITRYDYGLLQKVDACTKVSRVCESGIKTASATTVMIIKSEPIEVA